MTIEQELKQLLTYPYILTGQQQTDLKGMLSILSQRELEKVYSITTNRGAQDIVIYVLHIAKGEMA